MKFERSSGILLHPTSFPGRYGIGDLGDAAYRFVDFMAETGQTLWQLMPLGPTGYGDSPYASFSAFAGNPMLISPDLLAVDNYLMSEDLAEVPDFPPERVDFGPVLEYKRALLARSFSHFEATVSDEQKAGFEAFIAASHSWLDDYALFAALKDHHNGAVWNTWEKPVATHQAEALIEWREKLANEVRYHCYLQYQFHRQWSSLKQYANERSIKLIGDIPIFVAYDSADAWANPEVFYFDEDSNPTVVAGVPPDYFSATGQRWGNPLYKWEALAAQKYSWWITRFQRTLELVDIVRIDHFRGFEAFWAVPVEEETAIKGQWIKAPGVALFTTVQQTLGDIPIIAEDLGLITPQVEALRDMFNFPGMKILHFAFGGDSTDPYLPHNYKENCLVYTGSHDNDTTQGWFQNISEYERAKVQLYLGRDGGDIAWDLIRLAFSSVANMAIIPLQDILNLGSEARMNLPGHLGGNWSWRYWHGALDDSLKDRLGTLTRIYSRNPVEVARIRIEKEERLRLESQQKDL